MTSSVKSRSEAVEELKSSFAELNGDMGVALERVLSEDSQFNRRSLVRALFAFIEGITYQLSSVAVSSAPLEVGIFSPIELLALREENYEVADSGEVQVRSARIPIHRRIRLAIQSYPRIHGAKFDPDYDGEGWSSLRASIRIRDRLTHPKSRNDLEVSDGDVRLVGSASKWFHATILGLLKECARADDLIRTR